MSRNVIAADEGAKPSGSVSVSDLATNLLHAVQEYVVASQLQPEPGVMKEGYRMREREEELILRRTHLGLKTYNILQLSTPGVKGFIINVAIVDGLHVSLHYTLSFSHISRLTAPYYY